MSIGPHPPSPTLTFYYRNCAFHTAGHEALLTLESSKIAVPPSPTEAPGIDALPCILLPLAGPEDLDLEVYRVFQLVTLTLN